MTLETSSLTEAAVDLTGTVDLTEGAVDERDWIHEMSAVPFQEENADSSRQAVLVHGAQTELTNEIQSESVQAMLKTETNGRPEQP